MVNPNDLVRNHLLTYFYERNSQATSTFRKRGSATKISDIKRDMKLNYGLSQQQVISNLTYLIDRGWVKTIDIEKTVQVKGGTIPSTITWYQISADGIDKFEGESEFKVNERYPGINIMALGGNTITLGDGNVVNAQYESLHNQLSVLKEAVSAGPDLLDTDKLNLSVDIESIKDQLAKSSPDKKMIEHLWNSVQQSAVAAGLIDHISKITPLITNLSG